jgi:cytidylate kinase
VTQGNVIAIDGPAGSGKSTVARAVADRLGVGYLDTGAMYRSVALAALRRGADPADEEAVAQVAREADIRIDDEVTVDGVESTGEIRGPEVSRAVSDVASNAEVRQELVRRQRQWAEGRGRCVVEGRDIGSVVFPDAGLKVYLTASDEARAERRSKEGGDVDYGAVAADIARRDEVDSTRGASPLVVAEGAAVIDTTGRTVDEVVEEVLGLL